MEITPAPGEFCDLPAGTGGLNGPANLCFSRGHFVFADSVFLERVICGMNLHRAQRNNLSLKQKPDVLSLRGLLKPVPESPPAFGDR